MLSEMLNFNQIVQKSIKGNKLISLREDLASKLDSFTKFRDQGSFLDKLKLKSLILDLIHNIAVVEDLIQCKVNSLDSWGYLRLIKYELQSNLKVKMVDAVFDYTFE
jgi:dynein heavy chain 2